MLELRKRHQKKCPKHEADSPFSADLNCKRCAYYAFGNLNGKKIRQSLDTTDKQEASQRLLKMEANAKAPAKYTLTEAIERYLKERENSGHRPKSIKRYKYSLNRLTVFAAGKGVTQLRQVTVDTLGDWKATWNDQTDLGKQREQQRMTTFFRWCYKRKYIDDNPTDGLTPVKAETGNKRERFTDEEIKKIFDAVNQEFEDQDMAHKVHTFLSVLRYTALRIGDVTNLQSTHLNGDKILLRTLKTGQSVFTVVPESVVNALHQIKTTNGFYFYPGNDGTLETWKKKWSEILQPVYIRAGVKFRSHAWRDTLVYKMLQAGISIDLIARLLGHSSSRITWQHYSAWVPELQKRLEEAVRAVIHDV